MKATWKWIWHGVATRGNVCFVLVRLPVVTETGAVGRGLLLVLEIHAEPDKDHNSKGYKG